MPDSRLRYCSCYLRHPYRVMPRGLSPCRQQSGRVYFPECADHHRTLSDLLLLYGHIDVVPVEGQNWQHPPFEGKNVDGWIWGRGTLDMKGGIAMMLAAFLRAKAEGLTPPGDVLLLVLSDEEAGGDYGARFLVEEHAGLFDGVRYALGEFGGFPLYVGGRRFYPIQVAEKQRCFLRAVVRGPGGHGALPMRGGAMAKLARLLKRLDRRRLPVHVTPVARRFLETMAACCPGTPPPI